MRVTSSRPAKRVEADLPASAAPGFVGGARPGRSGGASDGWRERVRQLLDIGAAAAPDPLAFARSNALSARTRHDCLTSVKQLARYIQTFAERGLTTKQPPCRRPFSAAPVLRQPAPRGMRFGRLPAGRPRAQSSVLVIGEPPQARRSGRGTAAPGRGGPARPTSPRDWSGSTRAARSSPASPSAGTSATTASATSSACSPPNGRTAGRSPRSRSRGSFKRQLASRSGNPLKDTLGAVDEIVADDRPGDRDPPAARRAPICCNCSPSRSSRSSARARAPARSAIADRQQAGGALRLDTDGRGPRRRGGRARGGACCAAPRAGGGHGLPRRQRPTSSSAAPSPTCPYARRPRLPRNALRFDPVAGLFGLVPARADGPLADRELRRLLSQAIDREALIAALNVPGLVARATLLEPGLDGLRRPGIAAMAGDPARRTPARCSPRPQRGCSATGTADAPHRTSRRTRRRRSCSTGWRATGARSASRSSARRTGEPADLKLIDPVAPSTSPAWFLRQFRCGVAPLCDAGSRRIARRRARRARSPPSAPRLLAEAGAADRRGSSCSSPIAAPIRWSLVSDRVQGFAEEPLRAATR